MALLTLTRGVYQQMLELILRILKLSLMMLKLSLMMLKCRKRRLIYQERTPWEKFTMKKLVKVRKMTLVKVKLFQAMMLRLRRSQTLIH